MKVASLPPSLAVLAPSRTLVAMETAQGVWAIIGAGALSRLRNKGVATDIGGEATAVNRVHAQVAGGCGSSRNGRRPARGSARNPTRYEPCHLQALAATATPW